MEINLQVIGTEELAATLRTLPDEVQGKFMVQALNAGARPVRDEAQAEAPVRTGALATSIIVRTRGGAVLVGPDKATYDDKRKMRHSSVGLFQEKGTKNHFGFFGERITAQQAQKQRNKQIITIDSTTERMPARPFLGPALVTQAGAAFQAMADKLKSLIEAKFANKKGK